MRLLTTAMLGVLLAAHTTLALAEDCQHAATQSAIDQCALQAYQQEDALLNHNYKALMAHLNHDQQTALNKVQRAWVQYRDLNCHFIASQYQGGSIYPAVLSGCLTDMTKVRNLDFKAMKNAE